MYEWEVSMPLTVLWPAVAEIVWQANGGAPVDLATLGTSLVHGSFFCRPPRWKNSWVSRSSTSMQPDNRSTLTERHQYYLERIYTTGDGRPRLRRPEGHRQLEGCPRWSSQTSRSASVIRQTIESHFDASQGVRTPLKYSKNHWPLVRSSPALISRRWNTRPRRTLKTHNYVLRLEHVLSV